MVQNNGNTGHKTFSCDFCKKIFEEIFEDSTNQAIGCAAEVYETHIRGNYGSIKYDDHRIDFVSGVPKELKLGNVVCDECICRLIEKGICANAIYM